MLAHHQHIKNIYFCKAWQKIKTMITLYFKVFDIITIAIIKSAMNKCFYIIILLFIKHYLPFLI